METPAGAADARKGLRLALIGLACVLAVAACTESHPASALAQNIRMCQEANFLDQRLAACSVVASHAAAERAQRAAALVERGVVRAQQGQHARAVADFGRALRLDPANVDALAQRGAVHEERGAYDQAVRDYDAALAINPLHELATYRREQALQGRLDRVQQHIAQLTETLTREPGNAAALNNRCWLRAINDQDLNAALADCNAALQIDPGHAASLDSRGLVHLKRSEFQAALADYEAALALEPGRGHFLYGRGLARLQLGQISAGEADLAAAETAEPGVARAYAGYGRVPSAPASLQP